MSLALAGTSRQYCGAGASRSGGWRPANHLFSSHRQFSVLVALQQHRKKQYQCGKALQHQQHQAGWVCTLSLEHRPPTLPRALKHRPPTPPQSPPRHTFTNMPSAAAASSLLRSKEWRRGGSGWGGAQQRQGHAHTPRHAGLAEGRSLPSASSCLVCTAFFQPAEDTLPLEGTHLGSYLPCGAGDTWPGHRR